jgi:hydrogenase maturation protein HypF
LKRVNIEINGIVQGVGFRPFIHKLVVQYGIKGWVKNTSRGVVIEAEGKEETLINFIHDIESKPPVLSFYFSSLHSKQLIPHFLAL